MKERERKRNFQREYYDAFTISDFINRLERVGMLFPDGDVPIRSRATIIRIFARPGRSVGDPLTDGRKYEIVNIWPALTMRGRGISLSRCALRSRAAHVRLAFRAEIRRRAQIYRPAWEQVWLFNEEERGEGTSQRFDLEIFMTHLDFQNFEPLLHRVQTRFFASSDEAFVSR